MQKSIKYPIGIQSFPKIREEEYSYVDKTRYIIPLVRDGGYYFLSRPRRFGKSLTISTIHAYFDGRRDLFKGLEIESSDLNWESLPVLHFDFNSGLYNREGGLEERLAVTLKEYEDLYGVPQSSVQLNPASRLGILISEIYRKTGKKVVILVDEYDKPLLGVEDNKELFEENQSVLKGFFGNLKSYDRCIHLAFLTGVARFNKVSIFSDLNNLNDISLTNEYADICGWSEKELLANFKHGIEELAHKRNEDYNTTVEALREFYDGYLFSEEGSRLFNPFSVLLALSHKKIETYWFSTGTPTFLAKRVKEYGLGFADFNGVSRTYPELIAVDSFSSNPTALMFQAGYLTIAHYDEELQAYELRFPNREVEIGFAKQLLPLYAPEIADSNQALSVIDFKKDLVKGDPERFMERLAILLKNMPSGKNNENVYRNFVYMLCLVSGTEAQPERQSYMGRSDLEVMTRNYVYIFEFKYDGDANRALRQIYERDYKGRFAYDSRMVFLIGANFSDKGSERGLTDWVIEKMGS